MQLHRHLVETEKQMIAVTGARFNKTVNRINGETQVESIGFLARGPLWTAESLAIAECVRHGQHEILVQMRALDPDTVEYVERIEGLRKCYKGIAFVPASMADYVAGQEDLIARANDAVAEARELASDAARIAGARRSLRPTGDALECGAADSQSHVLRAPLEHRDKFLLGVDKKRQVELKSVTRRLQEPVLVRCRRQQRHPWNFDEVRKVAKGTATDVDTPLAQGAVQLRLH